MNGFWSIVRKELLHLLRDPASLAMALMIPLIQLFIFGFAIDFDSKHIPTAVANLDNSRESRDYLAGLHSTQYIDYARFEASPDQVATDLRNGSARVGIVIPPGFARNQAAGNKPQIGIMIDGSDSQVAMRARMAFMNASNSKVDTRTTIMFNPDMRTTTFMIPGLIGLIMQIVTVSLTAFSLVKERDNGTLEQLMVSPLGKWGLMLGKLLPYAGLAMIETIGVLTVGYFVFDVRVVGNLALLLVLTIPFILAALAMGLLISTLARNQAQALQMTMLLMIPSFQISGFVFPRENMPGILYIISSALPLTHFLGILRGIIVRGAGFIDVLPQVLALLAIGFVLIALSTMRFRKSMN